MEKNWQARKSQQKVFIFNNNYNLPDRKEICSASAHSWILMYLILHWVNSTLIRLYKYAIQKYDRMIMKQNWPRSILIIIIKYSSRTKHLKWGTVWFGNRHSLSTSIYGNTQIPDGHWKWTTKTPTANGECVVILQRAKQWNIKRSYFHLAKQSGGNYQVAEADPIHWNSKTRRIFCRSEEKEKFIFRWRGCREMGIHIIMIPE